MEIISGGQTGADRGGLDAAMKLGIKTGGWIPRDRVAEDGKVPDYPNLIVLKEGGYRQRTIMNVYNSDATIIFKRDTMGRGSWLTVRSAEKMDKPVLVVDIEDADAVKQVKQFLKRHKPDILNIAGSRESKRPGIQKAVRDILVRVLV
jgi:hypothetical protein